MPFKKNHPDFRTKEGLKRISEAMKRIWVDPVYRGNVVAHKKATGNGKWLSDAAKYVSKHSWVIANKGNPTKCEHCGLLGKKNKTRWNIHWANISGEYKRDLEDFMGLCPKCHKRYDNQKNTSFIKHL